MLESIILPIEKGFDTIKFNIKKKLNLFDPVFILPYRGYGNKEKIILMGRVLERERIVHDEDQEDNVFKNLFRFYKRYESDEIPHVDLEINYKGKKYKTKTDDEGYYNLEFKFICPKPIFNR